MKMKATVKPAFNAQACETSVKFQQDYKKALTQQNKNFNQNGKFYQPPQQIIPC